jgi:hypothetical protein
VVIISLDIKESVLQNPKKIEVKNGPKFFSQFPMSEYFLLESNRCSTLEDSDLDFRGNFAEEGRKGSEEGNEE